MGIKELWPLLTPYCERKPVFELQGKIVAIDLAGWVCESLNVVDYFVHPRHYLKNLFFRTCYLLMEGVVPVFVLEGTAPKLKQKVIAKRNELQFRGVKPKEPKQNSEVIKKDPKGRTRFNQVLKQCEILLNCIGIQCVQGPGEAEAYCSFLNKKGLVDGIISQDSDCFGYGAIRVYRNFSVSTQGKAAAQGGSVDVYDMKKICQNMDFGQQKIIVMALLCGCDYSEGISGVGKDSVLKLFNKYKNNEIMERIKSWRENDSKYTALEMKVDDKNICSNCGHLGKTIIHTKSGCSTCRTPKGCDETLWKEERLSIKAELMLRKKALIDNEFPSQEIIDEFLFEPLILPKLNLNWKQPNIVKFIKQIGNLLQWPEIYCFQKFLPLLTRWQIVSNNGNQIFTAYVLPELIHKKRTLKGTPSYEIVWKDEMKFFKDLIPENQIKTYIDDNPKGIQLLWSTIEPADKTEKAYPELVETFLKSIEKPKKPKRTRNKIKNDSLSNMNDLIRVTEEISKKVNAKPKKSKPRKGLQLIDKFFTKENMINNTNSYNNNCSTPIKKICLADLELDDDQDEENNNLSAIINGIISRPKESLLNYHAGKMLVYDKVNLNISLNTTKDDLALLPKKRNLSSSFLICQSPKRFSLSDSIKNLKCSTRSMDDIVLINSDNEDNPKILNHLDRFLSNNSIKQKNLMNTDQNKSYFFGITGLCSEDEFEKSLDISFLKNDIKNVNSNSESSD